MVSISQLLNKIRFDKSVNRLGPDIPFTHWKLYFKKEGRKFCESKFEYFAEGAEVRPGVYAVDCDHISIGKNVVLRPGTMLFADAIQHGRIQIDDNVLLGSCVHMYVTDHNYTNPNVPIYYQGDLPTGSIHIESGCWIGANVTILKGVTIGKNSVVASGAVVAKNVEPYTVVGGVPAKLIKRIK